MGQLWGVGAALMLSDLAAFTAARRYIPSLLGFGAALAVLGAFLFFVGSAGVIGPALIWRAPILVPRVLGYVGLALGLGSAGVLSAAAMAFGRNRLLDTESGRWTPRSPAPPVASQPGVETTVPSAETKPAESWRRKLQAIAKDQFNRLQPPSLDGEAITGWLQSAISGLGGVLLVVGIVVLWRRPPEPQIPVLMQRIYGAALIIGVFPLLVLERTFANLSAEFVPEAPQINRLARVPLSTALGLGVVLVLSSIGFKWATSIQTLIVLLLFAVAMELFGRGAALLFIPFAPVESRRAAADSQIAGAVLRLKWPSLKTVNTAVRRQLGIDLSRSWALAYVRKAAVPVLAGMVVLGWLMSGVTALGVNQRGVYEALGSPVAVLGPGVHFHLPWPMGVIKPVEDGVVHQLPIEFLLPNGVGGEGPPNETPPKIVGAEDHPSGESDRLWTGDHPFEGSYLIASEEDGRQSFQLVDTDMAVIYRVGASNQAAMDAAYRLEKPDDLIQALSGQLLVSYFVQHQLLDVLGENREALTRDFQTQLQKRLDDLSSGLEVLAVSFEAIHPPPGAAPAYHDVQAAEIRAKALVFKSQAAAVNTISTARQTVIRSTNDATATGATQVAQAQSEAILFDSDKQAYALAKAPFVFERRIAAVESALAKASSVTIIDNRLRDVQFPTLDTRSPGAVSSPAEESPPPADVTPQAAQPPPPAGANNDDSDD